MPMIVTTTDSPSRITGFHGGGEVLWKGLGAPSEMQGAWDAIECATFPEGAVAGVHSHSHTEELWLVVSGRGVVTLGDQEHGVGSGDAILSSFDAVHGSRQEGVEPYFVVAIIVDVPVPRTHILQEGEPKGYYHVAHLRGDSSDGSAVRGIRGSARVGAVEGDPLRRVFKAPWRSVSMVALDPGAALGPRDLTDSEAFAFVTAGSGVARLPEGDVDLTPNTSLTLLTGTTLHLECDAEEPLEFYFVELGVPAAAR